MNCKEEFIKHVESIKNTPKADGSRWRNEDIGKAMGYTREHFQTLISDKGKITESNLIFLKCLFREVLENLTSAVPVPEIKNPSSLPGFKEDYDQLLMKYNKLKQVNSASLEQKVKLNRVLIEGIYQYLSIPLPEIDMDTILSGTE